MGTRIFYFFCDACGADTASYSAIHECPYCRAGRSQFRLVADTFDPTDSNARQQIELARRDHVAVGSRAAKRTRRATSRGSR